MSVIVKFKCFIVYHQFAIKTKNNLLAHSPWDIYQEKLTTKFNKALCVGDPRNFHNNYYLNLNFFYSGVLSLKTKKEASHPKFVGHIKRQKKNIEKRERELKIRKNQTAKINISLLLLFYIEKIIFR